MKIVELNPLEFDALFAATGTCFTTAAFSELNKSKCDAIRYLAFMDKKIRLGLILARRGTSWISPFSAPFGGFVSKNHQPTLEHVEEAIDALQDYLRAEKASNLRLTLPPLFYHPTLHTKIQHVCINKGFTVTDWDLNYHFPTVYFEEDYVNRHMSRNARRNWLVSNEFDLEFIPLSGEEGIRRAYDVIHGNRTSKGYYLSMSEDDLIRTSQVVRTDSFVATLDGKDLASAIVYHTATNIVQVVYWGDLPESKPCRAMHFLAHGVFGHYHDQNIPTIDVGPAMIDNKPNYGLCEFKESIGCDIQPKLTLEWRND
jgi:hypothetical protein